MNTIEPEKIIVYQVELNISQLMTISSELAVAIAKYEGLIQQSEKLHDTEGVRLFAKEVGKLKSAKRQLDTDKTATVYKPV